MMEKASAVRRVRSVHTVLARLRQQKSHVNAMHDWHELVYVLRGQYAAHTADGVLHLQPGDVVYYPCHTPHHGMMRLDDSVKLHVVEWHASPDESMPPTARMVHDGCGRIYSALTWMHARWCTGDAASQDICEVLLQAVVAEFCELATAEATPAGDPIAHALHWLRTNIAVPSANLSRLLASEAGMSPVQLRRAFKRATGETPLQCLRRLRTEAALPLIQHSDLAMDEIADRVGLYDASHLWRLVVQHLGRSPQDLRAAARQTRASQPGCIPPQA